MDETATSIAWIAASTPGPSDGDQTTSITSFTDAWHLIVDKLGGWWESAVALIPNALLALIILVIGFFIAGVTARASKKIGNRFFDSSTIVDLSAGIVKALIILGVVFVTLSVLNLHKTVTSLLAGAGILGLAIGFAFQDLASNFIAGFLMGVRRPFAIGDVIASGDLMGTVVRLNMRNTIIENFTGQTLVVPNKTIFENPLINYQTLGKRRLTVDIGVGFDSDLDHVEQVLRDSCSDLPWIHPDQSVDVWCRGFGDSAVNWQVFVWIKQPADADQPGYFSSYDIVYRRVFKALSDANITIPFPNRTLSLTGPIPPVTIANASEGESKDKDNESAGEDT